MNPVTRVLRTILQVLAALVVVAPTAVAFLAQFGVTVDGAWLGAVLGAAVVLVTTVQNALEQAGLIPELTADPIRNRIDARRLERTDNAPRREDGDQS